MCLTKRKVKTLKTFEEFPIIILDKVETIFKKWKLGILTKKFFFENIRLIKEELNIVVWKQICQVRKLRFNGFVKKNEGIQSTRNVFERSKNKLCGEKINSVA